MPPFPRPIRPGRVTAAHDREIVVFLLGMRIHKPWKPAAWGPTAVGFLRMVRWLRSHPEEGMLGSSTAFMYGSVAAIQYWDSFDALERFAKNRDAPHLPIWSWYRKAVEQPGDCGIWHETYVLTPGSWECVYVNMPLTGLPAVTRATGPGERGESSRARRGAAAASH